jgi:spermidine synthase
MVFQAIQERFLKARVAVIGLGAGDLAGYARPGEQWTFYEIDPAVEQIATNPAFFSFLADCPAPNRVVLGDGRLRLREVPDGAYDLLIVDAFSSDAIPAHLLTREAVREYHRALTPDCLLVLHISNRYLDLKPVVGNLAADAGLVARYQHASVPLP